MCFNAPDVSTTAEVRSPALTIATIRDTVQCEQPFFNQVLMSLLKGKVLFLQDEAEEVDEKDLDDPNTSLKLNSLFKRYLLIGFRLFEN